MKTFLINKIYFYSFPRGQLHIEKMSYLPLCVLGGEEEKGALPESYQTFEVCVAQTSGLVNLVFYRPVQASSY